MIYKKVMELKCGLMDLDMKAIIKKDRNMDRELIFGMMVLDTRVIGRITKSMEE